MFESQFKVMSYNNAPVNPGHTYQALPKEYNHENAALMKKYFTQKEDFLTKQISEMIIAPYMSRVHQLPNQDLPGQRLYNSSNLEGKLEKVNDYKSHDLNLGEQKKAYVPLSSSSPLPDYWKSGNKNSSQILNLFGEKEDEFYWN